MSEAPSTSSSQEARGEKHYAPVAEIGTGAYGTVYKARDAETGKFVALKKVKVHSGEEGIPLSTLREISTLKYIANVEHENIVKLLDIIHGTRISDTETEVTLVFEFIHEDLAMYLRRSPKTGLPTHTIKKLFRQLMTGLDFLHSQRIVHRDLKPQNILIAADESLKIADFGLARMYGFNMALTQVVVTLWYRAPEVLLQRTYASPVDIWSVGCIFAELYTRGPIFCGESDVDQLRKIFKVIGLPPRNMWPDNVSLPWTSFPETPAQSLHEFLQRVAPESPVMDITAEDLLQRFLKFAPEDRISATETLKHQYFNEPVQETREPQSESLETESSSQQTEGSLSQAFSDLESMSTGSSSQQVSASLESKESFSLGSLDSEGGKGSRKRKRSGSPS